LLFIEFKRKRKKKEEKKVKHYFEYLKDYQSQFVQDIYSLQFEFSFVSIYLFILKKENIVIKKMYIFSQKENNQ